MVTKTTCISEDFYLLYQLITTALSCKEKTTEKSINTFWFDKFFHSLIVNMCACVAVLWSLEHGANMITHEKLSTNQSNMLKATWMGKKCQRNKRTPCGPLFDDYLFKHSVRIEFGLNMCVSAIITGMTLLNGMSVSWPCGMQFPNICVKLGWHTHRRQNLLMLVFGPMPKDGRIDFVESS